MSGVYDTVKRIKQPNKGYLSLAEFDRIQYYDSISLYKKTNLHYFIVGWAVEQLTDLIMGYNKDDIYGYHLFRSQKVSYNRYPIWCYPKGVSNSIELESYIHKLVNSVSDNLSSFNIKIACELAGFTMFRLGNEPKSVEDYHPDKQTIHNIRAMVNRSVAYLKKYNNLSCSVLLKPYQSNLSGACDYMSNESLIDLKVLKKQPTSKHTLQLLTYFIMSRLRGFHIKKVALFNARSNTAYEKYTDDISPEILNEVSNMLFNVDIVPSN